MFPRFPLATLAPLPPLSLIPPLLPSPPLPGFRALYCVEATTWETEKHPKSAAKIRRFFSMSLPKHAKAMQVLAPEMQVLSEKPENTMVRLYATAEREPLLTVSTRNT